MPLAKTISLRVVALILGGVMAFGLGEIGLRVLRPQRTGPLQFIEDPRFRSIPVPNLHGRVTLPGVFTYSFAHDALGLRVTEFVDRERARVRVLLLGDSFTYGIGVSDRETFAYLLEQSLSRADSSVAVVNAGSVGKGTDYALRFFELTGRSLKPTLTVLCFFSNDFGDNGASVLYHVNDDETLSVRPLSAAPRSRTWYLRRSAISWLFTWSHVANVLRNLAARRTTAFGPAIEESGYVNDTNRRPTSIFLRHLAKTVTDAESDFVVFYIPRAGEVKRYREVGGMSRDEASFGESLMPVGLAAISLTPVLAASPMPLATLYYDEARVGIPNGHWTPAAHSIAAGFMASVVRARLDQRP